MANTFRLTVLFSCIFALAIGKVFVGAPPCDCQDAHQTYPDDQFHTIQCRDITKADDVTCFDNFLTNITATDQLPMYINIQYSNLDLLPDNFFDPHNVATLSFPYCSLIEVPVRLYDTFRGRLTGLHLGYNQIPAIPAGAFQGCSSLELLNLDANLLTQISAVDFQDLVELTELSVQENAIQSLDGFINLSKMTNLYFDNNAIALVDKNAFQGMTLIMELQLKNNMIQILEEGTFDSIIQENAYVFMEGNPFYCNCSLKWLQDWIPLHMTDDPYCVAPVQGPIQSTDFCPNGEFK